MQYVQYYTTGRVAVNNYRNNLQEILKYGDSVIGMNEPGYLPVIETIIDNFVYFFSTICIALSKSLGWKMITGFIKRMTPKTSSVLLQNGLGYLCEILNRK